MGFFSLFPPIIYGWTQCGVGSRRWQPQSLEGEDIPATGLKVSRSRRGGRAWHSATGEGCNRHRGRIVCDAELGGENEQECHRRVDGDFYRAGQCVVEGRILPANNQTVG